MRGETLLPKTSNKIIITYDLFGKKHKRPLNKLKFRVGVYGILKDGNKILVQRHPLLTSFGLPGGGIEMDESMENGLKREFYEETGLRIKIKKLLDVQEDMFTWKNEDAHSIQIYYEVKKVAGKLLGDGNKQDTGEVKFFELNKLNKTNTQRMYWKFIEAFKKTMGF